MSVLKRPIGRRVLGAVVGASLMTLGLAAPAFAQPTVASFTPTSGGADCVVGITGTNFDFPEAQTDVGFLLPGDTPSTDRVDAADFTIVSATEIWAVVPAAGLTAGTSYFVEVENPDGVADSTALFTFTAGAGGCAPTIATFTPPCGLVGTQVALTGTNLLQWDGVDIVSAEVRFAPYGATEVATAIPGGDSTSLTVVVPITAETGRIQADNGVVAAFSASPYTVVTNLADCPTVVGDEHARSVTLSLRKHLVAKGKVSLTDSTDTFTQCIAGVTVKIQKRKSGNWKTVGSTTTNDNGAYKKRIKDKPGKYRAKAPKVTIGTDECLKAVSPKVRHRH